MSTLKVSEIRNASSATGGLSIAADGVVSGALPYPNRNLLYNGAMQVAQRGTSTAGITSTGYYTADRWRVGAASLGTWTQTVENDAPTGSGFRKSLKMLCTTADAAPVTSDLVQLTQLLEGQDLQRIAKGTASAQELTISFWVKSNVTGTYIVELRDTDNSNRLCSKSYTISASATWEKKTITFPADTTGEFANDNGESLNVQFWLAAGPDYTSGTLQTTWGSLTQANRAVGQTNLAAATNNYWQVTGVQLEVGDTATEFEFKSFGQELAECQRYYYLHAQGSDKGLGVAAYYNSTYLIGTTQFPVSMRTAPTLVATSGTNYYRSDRNNGQDDFNSLSLVVAHENQGHIINNSEVSGTAGDAAVIKTFNASTNVAFSAEL